MNLKFFDKDGQIAGVVLSANNGKFDFPEGVEEIFALRVAR